MVLERAALKDVLYRALPYSATRYLVSREKDITSVFESWIRGQSLLAGCMFITTYFGLHLID